MILPPHHNVGQFVLSLRIAEINTLHPGILFSEAIGGGVGGTAGTFRHGNDWRGQESGQRSSPWENKTPLGVSKENWKEKNMDNFKFHVASILQLDRNTKTPYVASNGFQLEPIPMHLKTSSGVISFVTAL